MSTILFDARTGRLRLDRPAFDTLLGWATGRRPDGRDELHAAGLIDDDGTPVPVIRAGVGAIVDPVCQLVLRTQDATGRQLRHEGWVSTAAASLLLTPTDEIGLYELASMHPSFLPEAIARLVLLGSRPRAAGAGPVLLDVGTVDDLTGPDTGRRAAAADRLIATGRAAEDRQAARSLGDGILSRWEAVMTWDPARGSAGRRAMHVIDTARGMWLLEPAGTNLLVSPATPTAIWRLLTTLLPGDHELDPLRRPDLGNGLDLGL